MAKSAFFHLLWIMVLSLLLLGGCSSSRSNQKGGYDQQQTAYYNHPRTGYERLPSDQPPAAWAHSPEYNNLFGPGPMDRINSGFFVFLAK